MPPAWNDKPVDLEDFGCLLDRRSRLVARQLLHQRKDDLGVGTVIGLLGLPHLHHLEPIGSCPPDVPRQPSTEWTLCCCIAACIPSYISTGAGTVMITPYIC